ncbi:hypothetical protein FXO38_23171 [Capsicum annuum]|uniref:Rhodanese domain-containing protein n=1 Tax=Capsicum annuum TaxID=4072 RepID=A0A2G2ZHH1_CAPAN|nr:hypothetical protein FXO38_23171 [Capsicum annuum]KAF3641749.1 hypothetical protein FXO37_22822 [Capsicum annuum]PHT81361.1 hypothetical protein T459_14376 [Capsicum annuum]
MTALVTAYQEFDSLLRMSSSSLEVEILLPKGPLKLNYLSSDARISNTEYIEKVMKKEAYVLVDVQPAHHYKIGSLPNSMKIPLSMLKDRLPKIFCALEK